MGGVVDLDAQRPHFAGLCSCLKCSHEWMGVVPVAATTLECPACGNMSGVKFSAREVRLARALEQISTGRAPGESAGVHWNVCKSIAAAALEQEGWGQQST